MKKNSIITIFSIIFNFFLTAFSAINLFFNSLFNKKSIPIKENKFLDIFNFFAHIGPKSFWKKPTGIKIGRSPATFLHYIFHKEEKFTPKK